AATSPAPGDDDVWGDDRQERRGRPGPRRQRSRPATGADATKPDISGIASAAMRSQGGKKPAQAPQPARQPAQAAVPPRHAPQAPQRAPATPSADKPASQGPGVLRSILASLMPKQQSSRSAAGAGRPAGQG